jgi:hypothetical protein
VTLGRFLRSRSTKLLQRTTLAGSVFCLLVDSAGTVEEVPASSAGRGLQGEVVDPDWIRIFFFKWSETTRAELRKPQGMWDEDGVALLERLTLSQILMVSASMLATRSNLVTRSLGVGVWVSISRSDSTC